jgi:putative acetyltransferase
MGTGDLPGDPQGLADRHRAGRDAVGQRLALHELLDERANVLSRVGGTFFDPIDRADVRVVQGREQAGLAGESCETVRVAREGARQDLDRDIAPQLGVMGAIHLAHAARAEQTRNLVMTDPRPGRDGHGRRTLAGDYTARDEREVGLRALMIDEIIRPESSEDLPAIREINLRAFGGPVEADLVDALRRQASPFVSLVFESAGEILGHIAFSPVTIHDRAGAPGADQALGGVFPATLMGLAPMAVTPEHQRQGIGSRLVAAGLDACRALGTELVIVLGHPEYYPRFGFHPAVRLGLDSDYDVQDEVFMALELQPGAFDCRFPRDEQGHHRRRVVRYHAAFGAL